jgi:hypothetical protein
MENKEETIEDILKNIEEWENLQKETTLKINDYDYKSVKLVINNLYDIIDEILNINKNNDKEENNNDDDEDDDDWYND